MNYKFILFPGLLSMIFAACHMEKDELKPTINITTPHDADSIKTGVMIYLKGTAKDNDAIHEISYEFRGLKTDSLYLSNSFHVHMGDADFSDSMKMPAADLRIKVKAEDHSGNEAETEVILYYK